MIASGATLIGTTDCAANEKEKAQNFFMKDMAI
jgi:hypothetical protein